MFFSYAVSIFLLSLALYGFWHVIRDAWDIYRSFREHQPVTASLLIIVQNNEDEIEGIFRYLLKEFITSLNSYEFVFVDYGSRDLTPAILDRLVEGYPQVKVVHLSLLSRPVPESLAFCQGDVVYVIDLVNRLNIGRFTAAVDFIRK